MSSLMKLPAMRALKTSPKPWSKISSTEVRESMQLKTAAKGHWPSRVSFTCCSRFLFALRLAQKRLIPLLEVLQCNRRGYLTLARLVVCPHVFTPLCILLRRAADSAVIDSSLNWRGQRILAPPLSMG